MANLGSLVLRRWIKELVLGSEALSSPRVGQLLEVLREHDAPGPSRAPDAPEGGAELLVSDGTHSVRCQLTREALDTSPWEEKEFGFRGTEGRLLLLQDCGVRIRLSEEDATAEFYLQVNRFNLLPMEQRREPVASCNQDPDVRRKLYDCLEEHLSESTSPSAGLSLSQLLDEVQEDQEHWGALVRLAESCLVLAGPCPAPCLTRWATLRHQTEGEAPYTVPSLYLHMSEHDRQILSSLDPGQRAQGGEAWRGQDGSTLGPSSQGTNKPPLTPPRLERPPSDLTLQDLSLTLFSSSSSSSGIPAIRSQALWEESDASVSLLPALPLATPSPGPLPPRSPHRSHVPNSSPLGHMPSPYQVHETRAKKPILEFKVLRASGQNRQPLPRPSSTKEALASSPVWDPPERHKDGSTFQYLYSAPCASLCTQVQAARLPPQLVAWALHLLMEPQPDPDLTQL